MPSIREARMEDLEALGQIAYATGFFGASAEVYFPSQALFRDLWVRPYLAGAGGCNLIAEDDGKPLGFIIGTLDLTHYQRWMLRYLPQVIKDSLFGRYPLALPSLRYLLRMAQYRSKLADSDQFPAQLHLNLFPESRGLGLGRQLLERHLECLRKQGVRGVQLSSTRENVAALGLYLKSGFKVYQEYLSPLWRSWLGRDALHLTLVLKLSEIAEVI